MWSNSRINEINEDEAPPKSIIVKIPTIESLSRLYQAGEGEANTDTHNSGIESTVRMMHNDECAVYKLLDGEGIVPMPRCHLAVPSVPDGDRGLIMLEDMSDVGVGMRSFGDHLNLAQTFCVAEALASLHAWSVKTTAPWKEKVPSLSERSEIYKTFTALTPMLSAKARDQMVDQFGQVSVEKVVSWVNAESYLRILDPELTPRPKLPVVLVHGDIHNMNVMFEKRVRDGRAGDKLVALFDFQLVHRGYGSEDIARLMIMGTSSVIRRQHEQAILTRYIEVFNTKVTPRQHIDYDSFKEAYDEMFCLIGLWISMSAAFAEEFLKKSLEKVNDVEKRKDIVNEYILNNAYIYRDIAKMLEW